MKYLITSTLIASAAMAITANAAWQRVGGLEKRPVDSASDSIFGTKISSSKGVAQPENLLSDDVALSSKLGAGTSEIVINMGRQPIVDLVTFINEGAEGRASLSSSMDQRAWAALGKSVFTSADRSITLKFASAQARYVKIEWDLAKGGAIKALGIYGSDNDYDFKVREAAKGEPTIPVNIAGGLGGTRIIYINPNPVHGDEVGTKYGRFEFPESPEKYRTVIYDFGQPRTVTQIGSLHSPRPVRFLAYAFENGLPEKEDWRGRRSFDPAVFDTMKPIAQAEDTRGLGYVKTRPPVTVRARYMALRWEPDFNPPNFMVDGVTIIALLKVVTFSPGTGGPGIGAGSGDGNGDGSGNGGVAQSGDSSGSFSTPFTSPFSISGAFASSAGGFPSGPPGRSGNPVAPNVSP